MGKRRKFTNEFKLEAVRLAERGEMPVAQVARELGLNETVLRRWMGLFGKRARASPSSAVMAVNFSPRAFR